MLVAITYDLVVVHLRELGGAAQGPRLNTLKVSAIAIVGAFLIGAVLGAARAHRIPVLSQLAAVYVEVDPQHADPRPDLLPLLRAAAAIGPSATLDAFTVAWLSVMIWGGAYNTENFRAGFEAVPHRFREAGLALGFGRLATFFNVTLPIGGRIALPRRSTRTSRS